MTNVSAKLLMLYITLCTCIQFYFNMSLMFNQVDGQLISSEFDIYQLMHFFYK